MRRVEGIDCWKKMSVPTSRYNITKQEVTADGVELPGNCSRLCGRPKEDQVNKVMMHAARRER